MIRHELKHSRCCYPFFFRTDLLLFEKECKFSGPKTIHFIWNQKSSDSWNSYRYLCHNCTLGSLASPGGHWRYSREVHSESANVLMNTNSKYGKVQLLSSKLSSCNLSSSCRRMKRTCNFLNNFCTFAFQGIFC